VGFPALESFVFTAPLTQKPNEKVYDGGCGSAASCAGWSQETSRARGRRRVARVRKNRLFTVWTRGGGWGPGSGGFMPADDGESTAEVQLLNSEALIVFPWSWFNRA
jgi:hypothetical protein